VHGPTAPGTLTVIGVSPNTAVFPLSQLQMAAAGFDAEGKEVPLSPTWSVTGGGTISATGVYTAAATPGTVTITATSGSITGTATITVTVGPVASLAITPASQSVVAGATQQFTVTGKDVGGNSVPVTAFWSATGGGTISPTGLFTAGATAGTFVNAVTATAGGITASATVTVVAGALASVTVTPNPAQVAAGGTQQFTATGRDASGNVVAITPTWTVVAGGGTISAADLFTATGAPNTYTNTVVATAGSFSGTATVVIATGTLASITVSPNPASMVTGSTVQFNAVGRDAAGNTVPVTPVWSIASSGSAAAITVDGIYTAGPIAGIFANEVIATSGTIVGRATVIVNGGPPTNSAFLGNAARFAVLAGGAVTCTVSGAVTGPGADVGSSTSTVNGFPPCTLTGAQNVAGVDVAAGQASLTAAYTAIQGIAGCTNLLAIDLGTRGPLNPLPPGCYTFTAAAALNGTLSLSGTTSDQWIFQIPATLDIGANANVILSGGAIPDNVRWAVGTTATLGSGSHIQGNILANTNIVLGDNATLNGRALARTSTVTIGTTTGGVLISKP